MIERPAQDEEKSERGGGEGRERERERGSSRVLPVHKTFNIYKVRNGREARDEGGPARQPPDSDIYYRISMPACTVFRYFN